MMEKRKKIACALAVFMVFMFLCTLISRAVYASGLCQVTTKKPERKNLVHKVQTEGIVQPGMENALNIPGGLRCKNVYVHTGDRITKETLIFEVDTEDLKEQIQEQQLVIQKLQMTIQDQESNRELEAEQKHTEYVRAREDYEKAVKEAEEQGIEKEEDPALTEAWRRLEDTIVPAQADSSAEINKLELSALSGKLEKYQKLLKSEGKIYAEEEGIVTKIAVSPGERTGDGAVMVYADLNSPLQFGFSLTKEQKKYVNMGDRAKLTIEGKTVDVTVDYIEQNEGNPDVYNATVFLPEGMGNIGQSGSFEREQQSEVYSCVIPIDALHADETGRDFVYILSERSGILGAELTAMQVYVKVLDKNDSYAAIEEGSIDSDTELIVSATKELKDRAVVRYRE